MLEFTIALSLILLTYFYLITQFGFLKSIITIVLLSRLLLVTVNNYLFFVLDADMDALNFYKVMLNPAASGSPDFIFADVYFYSKIINVFFKYLEPNIFLAQSFSICFCLINTVLVFKLINFFAEDKKTSLFITVLFSFFPSYINYSILTMREVFVITFLILSTYSFLKIYFEDKFKYIFILIVCFFALFVLHGGTLIGYFFLLFLIILKFISQFLNKIYNKKFNLILVPLGLTLLFIIFAPIIYVDYSIPYIRDISLDAILSLNLVDTNVKIQYISQRSPDSSFPSFLIPNSNLEFFLLLIPRYIYFQFAPLFMSITEYKYWVVIFIDSLPFMGLIIIVLKNSRTILKDKKLRIILFLFLLLSFTFTIGTFNIGQAIRHRVKFLIFLMILIIPAIKKMVKNGNFNFRQK